ncbi:MAG: TIGR03790 family protein [Flavobacteriales bacterium]|nr:TIGR03790 family protein [Flavobacteriales bacterium]
MPIRTLLGLITSLFVLCPCAAQSVSYDDVAVIVNSNSPASVQIGNYFIAARSIPANHLITIDAPLTTSITQSEFLPLRAAIEDHLIQNELVDSINYIVTTLGVPVRIDNGTCDSLYQFNKCSSFDTEVALLLGPLASNIAAIGYVANPFLNSTQHHTRATSGIYLVTRLAGPSLVDVLQLIDRSGPGLVVDGTGVLMVGDINNPDSSAGVQAFWNDIIQEVTDPVIDIGPTVMIDTTSQFLDDLDNVVGYVSLTGFAEPWLPNFSWAPGALAVEWYSYSGLHYDTPGIQPGYDRLSDWIGQGATAAVGTVNLTYASPWYNTRGTFERYLDTSYHFNAAESMYAGISWLSWIYEAIGDPKTSIQWSGLTGLGEAPPSPSMILVPNPSNGSFHVRMPAETVASVMIHDAMGRSIPFVSRSINDQLEVDLTGSNPGLYQVWVLTSSGRTLTGRLVVQP